MYLQSLIVYAFMFMRLQGREINATKLLASFNFYVISINFYYAIKD
jgi:hypothetical protein